MRWPLSVFLLCLAAAPAVLAQSSGEEAFQSHCALCHGLDGRGFGPLADAMKANGVPFAVVDVAAGEAQPPGARKLVLARTDQHVAWRGDAIPDDPTDLVGKLLGKNLDFVSA